MKKLTASFLSFAFCFMAISAIAITEQEEALNLMVHTGSEIFGDAPTIVSTLNMGLNGDIGIDLKNDAMLVFLPSETGRAFNAIVSVNGTTYGWSNIDEMVALAYFSVMTMMFEQLESLAPDGDLWIVSEIDTEIVIVTKDNYQLYSAALIHFLSE